MTASPELAHWNESVAALTFAARCRVVDLRGPLAPDAAATEAELAAANRKVHELSLQLRSKS